MKARDLFKRYCQGERDFRNADLSGESLRGLNLANIDLSGANLSETNLHGTKFTRATLIGVQFARARTGTRRRWIVPVVLTAVTLSSLISALLGYMVAIFLAGIIDPAAAPFGASSDVGEMVAGVVGLGTILIALVFSYYQGMLAMLGAVAVAIAVAIAIAIAIAETGAETGAGAGAVAFAFAGAGTVAVADTVAVAVAGAVAIAFAVVSTVTGAIAVADTGTGIGTVAIVVASAIAIASAAAVNSSNRLLIAVLTTILVLSVTALSLITGSRALAGDSRDQLIRDIAVGLTSLGGSSFRAADLSHAQFSNTRLKGAHFHDAVLHQTCFHLAQKLHLSRAYKTFLANRTVLNLLVSLKPEKDASYIGLDLKGANLRHADLSDINFTETDLSGATLAQADLQRANLTQVQALGTCFDRTNLTAACLEAWNIDNTTQLTGAICDHVYLLRNQQERRPNSGTFAPGEFTKLFEEVLNTIDLIFRNGIDWRAFLQAFKDIQVQYAGADLAIQSIENKGDGVMVVRLNTAPDTLETDKATIHLAFKQGYHKALKAAEQKYRLQLQSQRIQIDHQEAMIAQYRERSADMKEIALSMAQQAITVEAKAVSESKAMQGNDQSQNINIQGNANNAVVSIGAISGQVNNQIHQLAGDGSQTQLKDLLTQLKTAIETETQLTAIDKTDALEQVEKLAQAGQVPTENKSRAKRAIDVIKNYSGPQKLDRWLSSEILK